MSPQMIGPTTKGLYVCGDLEAISSLDKGTGSLVAGSPKLLTSRHGVTLSIYPLCHTNEIMFVSGESLP